MMAAAFIALLENSIYLAAVADPSLWYFANVALHPVLALALTVMASWRWRGKAALLWSQPLLAASTLMLGGGLLLGLAILVVGATTPFYRILHAHIVLSALGSALLVVHLWRAAARRWPGRTVWAVHALAAGLFLAAAAAAIARADHDARRRAAYHIENPVRAVPASMNEEGGGPASPFFPSSADTNVEGIIPANFFLTSQSCGRCHTEIYEQWNSSMHHF
jgi:hypothetical protein